MRRHNFRRKPADPKYSASRHRKLRALYVAQLVRDGYLVCTAKVCVFPSRLITNPNGMQRDGLHLGHNPDGVTYAGPQHNACNVKDGAHRGRARQNPPTTTLKW